jgi:hypothetical protein
LPIRSFYRSIVTTFYTVFTFTFRRYQVTYYTRCFAIHLSFLFFCFTQFLKLRYDILSSDFYMLHYF